MKYLLIALIKLYRITISKIKPPCCRFYPTCSAYGIEAIRRFGAVKGGYLTVRRIVRCNPFNAGGYDPVPQEFYFFKKHNV
jgi:hypothetical protein